MHKIVLLPLRPPQHPPQRPRLHVILVHHLPKHRTHRLPRLHLVLPNRIDRPVCQRGIAARIIRRRAVVPGDGRGAVALERVPDGAARRVDRDLAVVGAEAVALRVGVREEAALEDGVGRGLDAGDHVRGGEGGLLYLGKVVVGVAVERQLAERAEGRGRVRPDLGQVVDVPSEGLGIGRGEDLQGDGPGREGAALDRGEEVLGVLVGVGRG